MNKARGYCVYLANDVNKRDKISLIESQLKVIDSLSH